MRRPARTPTLLQLDAVECGAACLGMILGYYGRHVPLADLRRDCGVSRDGSRASNVVRAARRHGLEARGLRREVGQLRDLAPPYIVHWQFNHFVVVERLSRRSAWLNDPRCGHIRVTRDEFERSFTGVVLELRPGPAFRRQGRPPRLVAAMARRVARHRSAMAFGLMAGLLLVLPTLFLAGCAGVFIDGIVIDAQRNWMRPLLWVMLAAAATQLALTGLHRWCLRRLYIGATVLETRSFLWRLLHLPISFLAQRHPGEVANRVRYAERVSEVLAFRVAESGIQSAAMFVFLAAMARIHLALTCATLTLSAVNVLALRRAFRTRSELSQRIAQDEGRWIAASLVGVQMIEPLKASGMETGYLAKWNAFQQKVLDARQRLEHSVIRIESLPRLTERLTLTALLGLGGWAVIAGTMTLGSLVAFQILLTQFTAPLQSFVSLVADMQTIHADLLRLEDVQDSAQDPLAVEIEDVTSSIDADGTRIVASSAGDALELCRVTFGYSPVEPPLLEQIQLQVAAGELVAVVGRSGSGKSTLARLVCGLYVPWSGEIRLAGRPLHEIERGERVRRIGYVDQDTLLFSGSVRDNLTLWNDAVTDDELWRACREAGVDDVIRRLPGAMDAMLEEDGANLSGGERQRLEIARALVPRPTLLVLDEAMSALDAETEWELIEALRRRGCTILLITHRISASRRCDSIIVLRDGRLVARGKHETLVETSPVYRELLGSAYES